MSHTSHVDHDPRISIRVAALAAALSLNAAALLTLSLPSPPAALLLPVLFNEISAVVIDPPIVVPPPPLPEPPPLPVRAKPHATPVVSPPAAAVIAETPIEAPSPNVSADLPALAVSTPSVATDNAASAASNGKGVMQTLAYQTKTDLDYPRASMRANEQGEVILLVLVDASGYPQTIEIARSSGHSRLDRAARESVRRWTFRPVMNNGVATPTWGLVPVQFQLQRG